MLVVSPSQQAMELIIISRYHRSSLQQACHLSIFCGELQLQDGLGEYDETEFRLDGTVIVSRHAGEMA